MKKIGIGADDAALELKQTLVEHLEEMGYEVEDYSPPSKEEAKNAGIDYPDVAVEVAEAVARGDHEQAILCCGTGLGMSITANKIPGVRAAVVHDVTSARMAKEHNDANVVCIGARLTGPQVAIEALDTFLSSTWQAGRHARRIEKLTALEDAATNGTRPTEVQS